MFILSPWESCLDPEKLGGPGFIFRPNVGWLSSPVIWLGEKMAPSTPLSLDSGPASGY